MSKMDYCSRFSCPDYPWQAASVQLLAEYKYRVLALANSSLSLYSQDQRKFTPEALFMISVILLFVLLAVIGTAVTVIEYFKKSPEKQNCSSDHRENTEFIKNIARTYREKGSTEDYAKKVKLKFCKDYLNCFCIATNGRKILSTEPTEGEFGCFYGLRFITNIWIILLHVVFFITPVSVDLEYIKLWINHWSAPIVMNISYSVNIFFILSGFLNGYFFCREYTQKKGKISWLNFYRKRFLRITPIHMMVYWTYTTLFTYMGSGPLWPTYDTNPVCRKYWWWELLYINNVLPAFQQCLIQNWYLAVDMQLYIISPIFLVALLWRRKLGYGLMTLFVCGAICYNSLATIRYNLMEGTLNLPNYFHDMDLFFYRTILIFDTLYAKTHTRMAPYFLGLTLGHYLWKRGISKDKSSNKITLCCGWIITAILMWICFVVFHMSESSLLRRSLYNSLADNLFSCGIAWIVFACLTGQGGFVNRLLSFKIFIPLSRLSYCSYLIHIIVLKHHLLSSKEIQRSWNDPAMYYTIFYVIFWTYVISFLTSLFIEVPLSRLFQRYFRKKDFIAKEE